MTSFSFDSLPWIYLTAGFYSPAHLLSLSLERLLSLT